MLQGWAIAVLCSLENNMISVERILQYTNIPSEPPLTISESMPDCQWPVKGEIELRDLHVRLLNFTYYSYITLVGDPSSQALLHDAGTLRTAVTLRSERPDLHLTRGQEDGYRRKNRRGQVHLDPGIVPHRAPVVRASFDRRRRHQHHWTA